MFKADNPIKSGYRRAILKVLHYINQNLSGDVSLRTLAGIANYSPFHFQKLFSAAISESPKQYVKRLRLERAAHHLKVFPALPVFDIALGCGFSSPSIFSRAFKEYYGITAEDFRIISREDFLLISKRNKKEPDSFGIANTNLWTNQINNPLERISGIDIVPEPEIKSFSSFKIACIQTTLSYPENITFAFKTLMKWALPNGIITPETKYFGVWLDVPFFTSPDKCRYIAGIEINSNSKTNKGIEYLTMPSGKYATFSMKGDPEVVMNNLLALNHKYLEETGYEVSDLICYEIFKECPATHSYESIMRDIVVPVKVKME